MELLNIYSVPMWQSEYPNFEEKKSLFLESVYKYKDQNNSIQKTNIFGYTSPETLQSVQELYPLFQYICDSTQKACFDLDFEQCDLAITSAWLNINDSRQCMNTEHVHHEVFSGVFYLKAPKGSGKLVIKNPYVNGMWLGSRFLSKKNQFTGESIRIEPKEGSIIIFPSYLPHSVETNDHDDERISISFNIITLPKGFLKK